MEKIDQSEYEKLIAGAEVLSSSRRGNKVFRLADGHILKLFRLKRRFSSALWDPYAKRFVRAVDVIKARRIPCVEVLRLFHIHQTAIDGVIYRPLEGEVLRTVLAQGGDVETLLAKMARFLAVLHGKGIFFRAIHFQNILVLPSGEFGLIDVLESYFSPKSLPPERRVRNFKHMVRCSADRDSLKAFGLLRFIGVYLDASGFGEEERARFMKKLRKVHSFYKEL